MRWRRTAHRLAVAGATLCVLLALFPLVDMLGLVVVHGVRALSLRLLTSVTSGIAGGLANAIVGSLLLVGLALLIVLPLGVLGGTYVAERRQGRWLAVVRLCADVLAGVPSIVVGYFGFVVLVSWLGWGLSLLAGAVALAVIMLPYVFRATDLAVRRVADDLRDASLALGASWTTTVRRVVLRAAFPGILTGILLALGIAIGETAPLIYTAGWSNYMPTLKLLHSPVAYLTYVVWTYINEPFASANALAYAGALLLIVMVLGLNVAARLILARNRWAE